MNRVRLNNNLIISQNSNIKPTQSLGAQKKSFQEILNGIEKNQEIKFSKHALERLRVRNIDLTNIEINKINGAIQQAEKKVFAKLLS